MQRKQIEFRKVISFVKRKKKKRKRKKRGWIFVGYYLDETVTHLKKRSLTERDLRRSISKRGDIHTRKD